MCCDRDSMCFVVSVFTSMLFSGFSSLCAHTLNAPDACGLTFCCLSSNISMTIFFSPTKFNFFKDVLEGWVLVDPPPAPPPPPPRLPMLPMPRRGEDAAGESVVHRHWEGRQSGRSDRITKWSILDGSAYKYHKYSSVMKE